MQSAVHMDHRSSVYYSDIIATSYDLCNTTKHPAADGLVPWGRAHNGQRWLPRVQAGTPHVHASKQPGRVQLRSARREVSAT